MRVKREIEVVFGIGKLKLKIVVYPWWAYDFGLGVVLEFWNAWSHGYFRVFLYRTVLILLWWKE